MTHQLKMISCIMSVAILSACGGAEDEPSIGAALSATGGVGGAPIAVDVVDTENLVDNVLRLEEIEVEDTKSLIVSDDFAFDTAQHIDIDFDLESARDVPASVSVCTDYTQAGDGYDIDYDSCTVRGSMVDGVFSHQMEVTNAFSDVIAVVWFMDGDSSPVYRKFSVRGDESDRAARSVDGRKVIVWR